MFQSVNRKKLEFEGLKSNLELYLLLNDNSDKLLFIHPIISLFFDKLTMFRFVHNEILISEEQNFDFKDDLIVNKIPSLKFNMFRTHSLDFKVIINGKKLEFKCISPEFALIWVLKDINCISVIIALALLEFCEVKLLNKHQDLLPSPKIFNFIMKLGEIPLNRYDLIWELIENNKFITNLSEFPLFLDRNIRSDRKYDKIL